MAVRSHRTPLLVAIVTWLFVGIGYPYLNLALACRIPSSEACVWGKAYFPLTIGLSLTLLGGLAAGVVYAILVWRRRQQGGDDTV
jgi:hypothetical protein